MRVIAVLLIFMLLFTGSVLSADDDGNYNYQSPEKINGKLKEIASQNKSAGKFQSLGATPGNRDIGLLTLGVAGENKPAIMVVANMEGNYPIASEAALALAEHLVSDWSDLTDKYRWYIIACGNPDGAARFFNSPHYASYVNEKLINDDKDNAFDEDGPDDLNKDGFITKMRQLHPEGKYLEVSSNPLLLRKADPIKGEVGKYRLFEEGIDNDGDGKINEDGAGGVNPGHNFPHDFKHYTATDGMWATSESESRAILSFAFEHTDIAMMITFGRHNTLKNVPAGDKKAQAGESKYKIPERWANRFGLDKDTKYPLKELVEIARDAFDYPELTEDQLLQWLNVGAAVNPSKNDLTYWEKISEKYNDFIKEAKLDGKRLKPSRFPSGSIEEWAYFQYGVPTFAFDFWTLPEPKKEKKETDSTVISLDSLENMTSEQFIELGQEKIEKFLIDHEAPKMYTAERVIQGLEGGMMTPEKMAEFMRKFKKDEDEGGPDKEDEALFALYPDAYLPWQEYDHPTLGKVEIGGKKPFASVTPPSDQVNDLIAKQIPFVKELAGMLPQIKLGEVRIEKISSDVWRVDAWVENKGFLPYPTHQGKRCQRPSPVVVTITAKGMNILEGRERNPIGLLDGFGVQKVTWLIQGASGKKITIDAVSFSAGVDSKAVTLVEGGTK